MPFDEKLAERVRAIVGSNQAVTEKRMFGGVAWMLYGNMFVGITKTELMVRVGKDAHAAALKQPHARTMDFTGRPMHGYVFVAPAGLKTDAALAAWIQRAETFAATLPAKNKATKARR